MMAVILAGGKGTRLHPFTLTIPKPLLPLGDLPILEVVLWQLAAAGFTRVVITLGHMAHLFSACIGDGKKYGIQIDYVVEDVPLGTAGSLRLISDFDDHVLVMNGDLLTTLDYSALMGHHRTSGAMATIAAHRRTTFIDYGVIETSPNGDLAQYIEKPRIPYLVSMGINIVSRKCLSLVPSGSKFDMPQLMEAIRTSGQRVSCYESDCYWQDIGRIDDFQQASADFAADPDRFFKPRRIN